MKPCRDCGAGLANHLDRCDECGAMQNVPVDSGEDSTGRESSTQRFPWIGMLLEVFVRSIMVAIPMAMVGGLLFWVFGWTVALFAAIVVGVICGAYLFAEMFFQNQVLR